MARVYFIGGAPRVGKSTLALRVSERTIMPHASTDSIRATLRQTSSPQTTPDLFYLDSLNSDEPKMARLMRDHTQDIIAAADRESATVWPAIEAFAHSKLAAGQDVLIEGVAVLPRFLVNLDLPYTAVFLGNQSAEHIKVICDFARNHPDTWLGGLKPATVEAFAEFSRAYSIHTQEQTVKYGLAYFDMGGESFPEAIATAREYLLAKS